MLQHEHTDHEAHRFHRAAFVGKESGKLFVQPGLVNLVSQHGQRVLHVDDSIETGTGKIVMPGFLVLRRPACPTIALKGIINGSEKES
jgi:hypothetical protein